jgi:hypothetical protein
MPARRFPPPWSVEEQPLGLIRVRFSAYGVEKVFEKLFARQLRLSRRAETRIVYPNAKRPGSSFDFPAPKAIVVPTDINKIIAQGLKSHSSPALDPRPTNLYFNNDPGRRAVAKLLTKDEARRIAANCNYAVVRVHSPPRCGAEKLPR